MKDNDSNIFPSNIFKLPPFYDGDEEEDNESENTLDFNQIELTESDFEKNNEMKQNNIQVNDIHSTIEPTPKKRNSNAIQKHLYDKFIKLQDYFFDSNNIKQFIDKFLRDINHQKINSGLVFLELNDFQNNILNLKNKKDIIEFLSLYIKKFKEKNKEVILNYKNISPENEFSDYYYLIAIRDSFLLNINCIPEDRDKLLNDSTINSMQYWEVLKNNIDNFIGNELKKSKTPKTHTNNLEINSFLGLILCYFYSLEINIYWRKIIQCPLCSFEPLKSEARKNSCRSSLNKHQKKCPSILFEKNYKSSFWENGNLENEISLPNKRRKIE